MAYYAPIGFKKCARCKRFKSMTIRYDGDVICLSCQRTGRVYGRKKGFRMPLSRMHRG